MNSSLTLRTKCASEQRSISGLSWFLFLRVATLNTECLIIDNYTYASLPACISTYYRKKHDEGIMESVCFTEAVVNNFGLLEVF